MKLVSEVSKPRSKTRNEIKFQVIPNVRFRTFGGIAFACIGGIRAWIPDKGFLSISGIGVVS